MLKFLLSLFISAIIPLSVFAIPFRYCSPDLIPVVETIMKLPEAMNLIERANRDGRLSIESSMQETASFHGMWKGKTRTIYINPYKRTHGNMVQTLIFELHNAISDHEFTALWRDARSGNIEKSFFVEKAERIEFGNLKKAQAILESGISQKIFPKDCRLTFMPDFKLYYYFQQLAGHSDWFATQYDNCCPDHMRTPFRGTVYDLTKMSSEDKDDLVRYISLCSRLCSNGNNTGDAKALEAIRREKDTLQCCIKGTPKPNSNCYRASERYRLFQDVFGNIL